MKLKILALFLVAGLALPVHARALFEPPEGKVLLIAGQTATDIPEYLSAVQVMPAGLMSYTAIHGEGLTKPFEQNGIVHHLQMLVDRYPNTVLQIGLYLVNECPAIARGDDDAHIDRLAGWLKKTRRPVFLRIGYEFDGPHNHYPPEDYVIAYRYIVDRLRKNDVRNVAYVWHSYASMAKQDVMAWYPGDNYVDWVAISYFNQPESFMKPAIDAAKTLGKPIMIGEATPAGIQTKYANSWNLWFSKMFKFVRANNIQAISYISCDWDKYPQFKALHWGDCRITAQSPVLKPWLEETAQDRYLKSSLDLFETLGYRE